MVETFDLLVTQSKVRKIRERYVMLDQDLALFFQCSTKTLNQAVKRNKNRFPEGFSFRLTPEEVKRIPDPSYPQHGGRRNNPTAFTQAGVVSLSFLINTPNAIEICIKLVRAFEIHQTQSTELGSSQLQVEKFYRDMEILRSQVEDIHTHHTAHNARLLQDPKLVEGVDDIKKIENLVIHRFGIKARQLHERNREKSTVLPRHIFMYLSWAILGQSYKKIGSYLGGRDYTSVLYACKKIKAAMRDDSRFREEIQQMQSAVEHSR
jgi:hypothetical protein